MVSEGRVTVYGDDCDDCVQSRSYLERHAVTYGERDIISEPLTAEELLELAESLDGIEELAAPEHREQVAEMEEDEIAEFLAADATRLAHPVVTTETQTYVGYDSPLRDAFADSP